MALWWLVLQFLFVTGTRTRLERSTERPSNLSNLSDARHQYSRSSAAECDPTRTPIFVFLHALKSGGTLVSNILRSWNETATCKGSGSIGKLQTNSATNWDDEDRCRVAFFHEDISVSVIIQKSTNRCVKLMTLVRDPVELRQALFRTYLVGQKMIRRYNLTEDESDEWTHEHFTQYIRDHLKAAKAKVAAAAAAAAKAMLGPPIQGDESRLRIAESSKIEAIWGPTAQLEYWNSWKDLYPPQTPYFQNMLLGLGVGGGDRQSPFQSHFNVQRRTQLHKITAPQKLAMAFSSMSSLEFIGLTTRYSESMCLLAYVLMAPDLPFLHHQSRHQPDDATSLSTEWAIPADIYRATLHLAGPDAALYDHAETLFDERLSQMQLAIQDALARLEAFRDSSLSLRGSIDVFPAGLTNDVLLQNISRNQWCKASQLFKDVA